MVGDRNAEAAELVAKELDGRAVTLDVGVPGDWDARDGVDPRRTRAASTSCISTPA